MTLDNNITRRVSRRTRRKAINAERLRLMKSERGCFICGYRRYSSALEFHHLNADSKSYNVSALKGRSWDAIMREVEKCIILCSNCHRAVEAGELNIPPINKVIGGTNREV